MKEKVQIVEEAMIPTPKGQNLKSDLMVVNQGRSHVVDVTVRHEDTGYLQEGYKRKVEKYTPLMDTLAIQVKVQPGKLLPIDIGTRALHAGKHN
jgi:hypothetical protein